MQLRRMSAVDLWGRLMEHIADLTHTTTVGYPEGVASPLYYVELLRMEPVNTKTQFIDRFHFAIHAISRPSRPYSPEQVIDMVQRLEEAMTAPLWLPAPFQLLNQHYVSLETIKRDETDEGHAVCDYVIDVLYGFRIK